MRPLATESRLISSPAAALTSAPCELGGELTLCCGGSADAFAPKAAVSETGLSAISGFQRSAYSRAAEYLRIKRIGQMLIVDGQIHL
jgi:hypothetical protein